MTRLHYGSVISKIRLNAIVILRMDVEKLATIASWRMNATARTVDSHQRNAGTARLQSSSDEAKEMAMTMVSKLWRPTAVVMEFGQ